jgi:hypothetical protein
MSTISKKLALEIANNDGFYPGDPQVYAIIEFKNSFFNYKITYAVCHSQSEFLRYVDCHEITNILFTSDEILRNSFHENK